MRNVAPSRTLMRRSYSLLQIAFVMVSAGIFLAMLGLALTAVPLLSASNSSRPTYDLVRGMLFVGGVILGIGGIAFAVRAITWKTENNLAKLVGNELGRYLDDQYVFIRNINKLRLGYIDAVLVGPAGLLVFRIVGYQGRFLNEGSKWLKSDKKGSWTPFRANPTKEVVDDVRSLKIFFAKKELPDVPIFSVVVFIEDDPIVDLTLKDPVVPATHLASLYSRLQTNYLVKGRIEKPFADKIVKLLYHE